MQISKFGVLFSLVGAVAAALGALPPHNACAAEAAAGTADSGTAADSSASPGASDLLEELVVTAQKRAQSIDSVGMSITALSGEALKEQGVMSVGDLVKVDPSFVVSQTTRGEPVYQIRGVGYNDFSLAASPTVSVYTDEVPYAYPTLTKGATFDLARVEVLKGPQGTLFGQNATGGAVNYIAAKPTDSFDSGLEGTFGRFGAENFNGFVSGPLSDTVKARLAFNLDEGGAWQESDTRDDRLGSKDNKMVRLLLDWRPTQGLKVFVNLNAWSDNSETQAGQKIALDLQSPKFAAAVPEVVDEPNAPQNDQAANWLAGTHPKLDELFYQGSIRAEYALTDDITLTYLGSDVQYSQHDFTENTGENIIFGFLQNGGIYSTSQEFRGGGDLLNGKLNWIAGVNYFRTKTNEDQYETLIDSTSAYALTELPVALHEAALPPYSAVNNVSTDVSTAKALFGNLEYHVLDALDLHAGARYTQTDIDHGGCTRDVDGNVAAGFTALETLVRKGVGVVPATQGGCITFGPTLTPDYIVQSLDQHNVSWRVGADWTGIDKTLIYATISKGYKSGSFPTLTASSYLQLRPVTQESVLAYELGFKSRADSGRLEIDGAVFHYDYTNKQVEAREPDPEHIFGFLNALLNVPRSEEDGAELSAKFRATEQLTLSVRGTYLDSRVVGQFINYNPYSNAPINLQGESFPNTPKWSLGADAQYTWDLNAHYQAFVGIDGRYETKTQGAFGAYSALAEGYPSYLIDAYGIVDLRAGLLSADGHWRFEAFGNNVGNTYYWTQVTRPGEAIARFTGLPATYGVTAAYRFGR